MQPTPPHHTAARDLAAPNAATPHGFTTAQACDDPANEAARLAAADQEPSGADDAGDSLDDAARGEREDLRRRLRDGLGREPSDEELDEWLRQHTEGY